MKMNKYLFLSLVTIGAITACNTVKPSSNSSIEPISSSIEPISSSEPASSIASSSSSSEEPPVLPDYDIVLPNKDGEDVDFEEDAAYNNNLLLNRRVAAVAVGGIDTIYALERSLCKGDQLVFKSNDTSICTVDANGVMTGVAAGETTIEVSDKNHPDVKKVIHAHVFPTIKERQMTQLVSALDKANKEDNITAVVDHEIYERSVYKVDAQGNETLHMYGGWNQNLVCSKEDAYLRLYGADGDIKTDNGNITFTDYEWIFYTNQYFDAYAFHQKGDVKNYYPVSVVNYMEKGDRVEPLLDILDNIFTSGRDIFVDTIGDADLDRFLSFARANDVTRETIASDGTGTGTFYMEATYVDDEGTASQTMENNYGIPVGTPTPETDHSRFVIIDNKLVSYSVNAIVEYEIDGQKYKMVYNIDHYYERITDANKKSLVVYPDKSEYTLVDYLFAIQSNGRIIKPKFKIFIERRFKLHEKN